MPLIASAKKKMRQDKKRHARNLRATKVMKESIKALQQSPGAETLRQAYAAIDTAGKKHVLHKNKAARLKSQLAKKVAGSTQGKKESKKKKANTNKV